MGFIENRMKFPREKGLPEGGPHIGEPFVVLRISGLNHEQPTFFGRRGKEIESESPLQSYTFKTSKLFLSFIRGRRARRG
jgi:hypothetical protein